jgi:hypothetical protein
VLIAIFPYANLFSTEEPDEPKRKCGKCGNQQKMQDVSADE